MTSSHPESDHTPGKGEREANQVKEAERAFARLPNETTGVNGLGDYGLKRTFFVAGFLAALGPRGEQSR